MLRVFLLLVCLTPFAAIAEKLEFLNGSDLLVGEYLPSTADGAAKGVILFVHGDGASRYDADGYFDIIWDQLRDKGYATFSWDKPGVGSSSGNWLKQSMQDRQLEVETAIRAVQGKYGYIPENTGLMGFSQAGWVVPAIAKSTDKIGFVIGVGFATNWVDQGLYHSLQSNASNLLSLQTEKEVIDDYKKDISFFHTNPSYQTYLNTTEGLPMDKDRFEFVLKNFTADSIAELRAIQIPTLLLWGEEDQNVDARSEFKRLKQIANPNIRAQVIPEGTHSMLNHYLFPNRQMGLKDWLKMVLYEEDALADDFWPVLMGWLEKRG